MPHQSIVIEIFDNSLTTQMTVTGEEGYKLVGFCSVLSIHSYTYSVFSVHVITAILAHYLGYQALEETCLPCEFCGSLCPASELIQHQVGALY